MEPTVCQAPMLHRRQYRVTSREIQGLSAGLDACLFTGDFALSVFTQPYTHPVIAVTTFVQRNSWIIASLPCTTCLNFRGVATCKAKLSIYSSFIHAMFLIYVVGTAWNEAWNPALGH